MKYTPGAHPLTFGEPGSLGKGKLGGGFKYFLFSPLLGEMIQFD